MKLHCFGATQEVTGSCFLIENQNKKILIDCGLIQGRAIDEKRNYDALPFTAKELDVVILTHAHIDHSGRLPILVKNGFSGKIISHPATIDLCDIMLRDTGFLNEKEVETLNRKRERKGLDYIEPLYTVKDAINTMPFFSPLPYDKIEEILPNVKIRFLDAGHILGSAIVEMWLSEGGVTRKVVFSGDLGRQGLPILKDPTFVKNADVVIMESTYGDRNIQSWKETIKEFSQIIDEALASKGNILIPAFAVGRSQEILYSLFVNYDKLPLQNTYIFLDSPMAIEATKVYTKHWQLYDKATKDLIKTSGSPYQLPNLRLTVDTEQSMAINQIKQGAIIIAGSGMCEGGRIRHHLKHNIWRKQCHLLFVGYQAQGTLGRMLIEGASEIRLWGERVRVAAKIHSINGFSAHADQETLLKWYGHFESSPALILVHGEISALSTLQNEIYQKFTVHPWIPKYKDSYDLIKRQPTPVKGQ